MNYYAKKLDEWFRFILDDAKNKSSLSYAWQFDNKQFLELALDPNLSLHDKVFQASLHGLISNPISHNPTRGLLSKQWWAKNKTNLTNRDTRIQDSKTLSKKSLYNSDIYRYEAYLDKIHSCTKFPRKQKLIAMEIGSGNGGLARYFKNYYRNASYILVDNPVILYFAAAHLISEFPLAQHHFIKNMNDFNNLISREDDFYYLPDFLATEVSRFKLDIAISTHALGEMKNDTVKKYMDFIDRNQAKYIFSVNRFLHNNFNALIFKLFFRFRLKENSASLSFPSNYEFVEYKHKPWFLQNPYFDQLHPQYLLAIMKRNKQIKKSPIRSGKMNDIKLMDWYLYYGKVSLGSVVYYNPSPENSMGSVLQIVHSEYLKTKDPDVIRIFLYLMRITVNKGLPEEYYRLKREYYELTGKKFHDPFYYRKVKYYLKFIAVQIYIRVIKLKYFLFHKF